MAFVGRAAITLLDRSLKEQTAQNIMKSDNINGTNAV